IGRRGPDGPEVIRVQVPIRHLVGAPDAERLRPAVRVTGLVRAGGRPEFIQDVGVLVVDEQVRVAADRRVRRVRRAVGTIALDDRVGGNGDLDAVAFAGPAVGRDGDRVLGGGVVGDIDGDAVQGPVGDRVAEIRVEAGGGTIVAGDDSADDGRR